MLISSLPFHLYASVKYKWESIQLTGSGLNMNIESTVRPNKADKLILSSLVLPLSVHNVSIS